MSSLPNTLEKIFCIVSPAEINSVGGAIRSAEKNMYRNVNSSMIFVSARVILARKIDTIGVFLFYFFFCKNETGS